MKWHKVLNTSDLKFPFIRKVLAGSKPVCLIGLDEEVFAFTSKCPHSGADISTGWCQEGKIVCPRHRFSYDLQTGRGSPGQGDYLEKYPVEMREDGVYVGISSFWDFLG